MTESYSCDTLFIKHRSIVYGQPFISWRLRCKQSGASSGDTSDGCNAGFPRTRGTFFFGHRLFRHNKPLKCSCAVASLSALEPQGENEETMLRKWDLKTCTAAPAAPCQASPALLPSYAFRRGLVLLEVQSYMVPGSHKGERAGDSSNSVSPQSVLEDVGFIVRRMLPTVILSKFVSLSFLIYRTGLTKISIS